MSKLFMRIMLPIIAAGFFVIVFFLVVNARNLDADFYRILYALLTLVFLFGFSMGINFSMPMKNLIKMAEDLNSGNLQHRFYLDRNDEFGRLASALNRVADKLQEYRSELLTMERSVDIKVKARIQPMEETIGALEQKVKNRTIELQKVSQDFEKLSEELQQRNEEITQLKRETGEASAKVKWK